MNSFFFLYFSIFFYCFCFVVVLLLFVLLVCFLSQRKIGKIKRASWMGACQRASIIHSKSTNQSLVEATNTKEKKNRKL